MRAPASVLAVALALSFLLAGCADLVGRAPTQVERCHAATTLLFREDTARGNRSAGVPSSQGYATLLNKGIWTRATFDVTLQNGSGNWTAPARVLHNLSIGDAKIEFERGISTASQHDVNVTYGARRSLSEEEYATFCKALLELLGPVPQADQGPGCESIITTTVWRAWLDGREVTRSAACGGASNATRAFEAAVALVKARDPA